MVECTRKKKEYTMYVTFASKCWRWPVLLEHLVYWPKWKERNFSKTYKWFSCEWAKAVGKRHNVLVY